MIIVDPDFGNRCQSGQQGVNRWGGVSIMKIASLADVKARLSAYVEQCKTEGPVVITRNGKAVAVLLAP